MKYHISANRLTKIFRIPVKPPGLKAALYNLVSKKFNDVKAVDNVSFNIQRGEMVGFIGPNGAGKTTTLKMLSGLLYPTFGSAQAAGYIPWKRKADYLKKISMLMGNRFQMNWNTTVIDNMTVYKEIFGVSTSDFKNHVSELSEIFDITECLQKQTRNLSLGERSKCEFVIALLHKPEILYLDEPTLGMDVTMQLRIRQFIKEYNQNYGATVILTSHYMSDITSLCQRLLLINDGQLVYDGALVDLTDKFSPYREIKLNIEDSDKIITQNELNRLTIPAGLVSSEGNEYVLQVQKSDVVQTSSLLMTHYNLIDFNITNPPIEAIIDTIYTELSKESSVEVVS